MARMTYISKELHRTTLSLLCSQCRSSNLIVYCLLATVYYCLLSTVYSLLLSIVHCPCCAVGAEAAVKLSPPRPVSYTHLTLPTNREV